MMLKNIEVTRTYSYDETIMYNFINVLNNKQHQRTNLQQKHGSHVSIHEVFPKYLGHLSF